MRIFTPTPLDRFELCQPIDSDDYERFDSLINAQPRAREWTPIRVQLIHKDEGKRLKQADAPWLVSNAVVLRPRAVEALRFLEPEGEFLPLECEEAPLFVFNPTRLIDGLDEQKSLIHRFTTGRIMKVETYVLKAEVIAQANTFKLTSLDPSPTFFSERVVEAWNSAGLKGLEFTEVWSGN